MATTKKLILLFILSFLSGCVMAQQLGANQLKKDNWTIRGNASNMLQVDTSHIATQWKVDSLIHYGTGGGGGGSTDTLSLSNRINLKLNITNPTAIGRLTTDSAIVGNQGTEGGSIKVNGLNYTSAFKVSDINTNNVQVILHKHSTTIEPIIIGARSYSNTTSHTNMPNNENVISIYGSGWAGSSYKTFGNISIASAPSGTISNTSAPGQIILSTTPSGSIWSLPALTLNSDQSLTFGNASTTRTNLGTISTADTRLTDWTMEFTIDGQGSVISTGIDGTKNVSTNVSIIGWKLFEISGTPVSSTVDISLWKDTYANFPPTSVDTVNYWQRPTLTGAIKNQQTFSTPFTATKGDEIRLNANTVTGALKLKLVLIGTKQP